MSDRGATTMSYIDDLQDIKNMHLIYINAEAVRYCKEHGIKDAGTYQSLVRSMRHQAFLRDIQPYIKQKVRIEQTRLVSFSIDSNGIMERHPHKLPEELERAMKDLDELIIMSAQFWGLHYCPIPTKGNNNA